MTILPMLFWLVITSTSAQEPVRSQTTEHALKRCALIVEYQGSRMSMSLEDSALQILRSMRGKDREGRRVLRLTRQEVRANIQQDRQAAERALDELEKLDAQLRLEQPHVRLRAFTYAQCLAQLFKAAQPKNPPLTT